MMKKNIFYLLVSVLLIAALVVSGCGGDNAQSSTTTTSSTTTIATQTTTIGAGGVTTIGGSGTTFTITTTPTTTKTTTTKTTTPTVTTETATKPIETTTTTTQTTTTTTTTQTTTTTTTPAGETLGEILGRSAGIDSVKHDTVITSPGNPTQTISYWIKGNKMRMEMTAEGQTIITLLDMDAHTMYMYYPDQNMAMKVTYQTTESAVDEAQSITDYNPVIIGHETLDGKVCLVVEYTVEGVTARMWVWEQYGFPIKIVTTTAEGTVTIEYKNIEFTDIPDSMFELPAGVTIVTMTM